jgi:hypothetical protein
MNDMRGNGMQVGARLLLCGNPQPRTLPPTNQSSDVQQESMGWQAMASSLRLRSSSKHRGRGVVSLVLVRKRSSLSLVFHVEGRASDPIYTVDLLRCSPRSSTRGPRNVKILTCRVQKPLLGFGGIRLTGHQDSGSWHRLSLKAEFSFPR